MPWDDATVWSAMKPTMPWGQLPCLTYKVMIIINKYEIDQIVRLESKVKTQRTPDPDFVDKVILKGKMNFRRAKFLAKVSHTFKLL